MSSPAKLRLAGRCKKRNCSIHARFSPHLCKIEAVKRQAKKLGKDLQTCDITLHVLSIENEHSRLTPYEAASKTEASRLLSPLSTSSSGWLQRCRKFPRSLSPTAGPVRVDVTLDPTMPALVKVQLSAES